MQIVKVDTDSKVIEVYGNMYPLITRLSSDYLMAPDTVKVGWTFLEESGTFVEPPAKRLITRLAFNNRFTIEEAVAFKVAQQPPTRNPNETDAAFAQRQALSFQLQVLNERLNLATFIDLDRPDARQAVQSLAQLGILTPARVGEILDGPIQDNEVYHG